MQITPAPTTVRLESRRSGALRGCDKSVDAKRVSIEGVSRYGKAALVTMAFDTRFAVVLVGSSGEGGVNPRRQS
jgi:hypothetical protein